MVISFNIQNFFYIFSFRKKCYKHYDNANNQSIIVTLPSIAFCHCYCGMTSSNFTVYILIISCCDRTVSNRPPSSDHPSFFLILVFFRFNRKTKNSLLILNILRWTIGVGDINPWAWKLVEIERLLANGMVNN